MKEPIFKNENGTTVCEVVDSMGRVFRGEARCHPDDEDFKSPITGGVIAEMRARISAARTYRDDLKIKLAALRQYYYSIVQSKQFDKNSYPVKMLFRQINLLESDLDVAVHQLAVLKVDLYEYINEKDKVHKYLREHSDFKNK